MAMDFFVIYILNNFVPLINTLIIIINVPSICVRLLSPVILIYCMWLLFYNQSKHKRSEYFQYKGSSE